MICVVHGSLTYNETRPTSSKRRPAAIALACAAGFFTSAQPAIPARAAAAMSKFNENFFIAKKSRTARTRLFALLGVNAMQEAMHKRREQHRYDADERQP